MRQDPEEKCDNHEIEPWRALAAFVYFIVACGFCGVCVWEFKHEQRGIAIVFCAAAGVILLAAAIGAILRRTGGFILRVVEIVIRLFLRG